MMSQVGIALLCAKADIAVVIDACRTNAKALQCVPTESLRGARAMPSDFHKEAANCRRMAVGYKKSGSGHDLYNFLGGRPAVVRSAARRGDSGIVP